MKKNKKRDKLKSVKTALLFVVIISAIPVGIFAYFNVSYADKIFPNILINKEDYSSLTKEEAYVKMENAIKNVYGQKLTFTYNDKKYQADLLRLGVSFYTNKTVDGAFDYGRGENIFWNIREQIALINSKKNFPVEFEIDKKGLESFVSGAMSEIENPPKNFRYKYVEGRFIPFTAETGIVIDRDKMINDIKDNLKSLKNDHIKIELAKKEPEIKEDLDRRALSQAENILNKKVVLKYNSSLWEVQKEDFALWLNFDSVENPDNKGKNILGIRADKEKIKDYFVSLVPQINRAPVNAQLEFKNGKVDVFSLDRDGISLQMEKSEEEIEKNVFIPDNYKDDSEKEIEIRLITENIKPEITIESIDNMGITALLATGESNFSGSPKNRKHNIAVGAGKFQGILIGPGDEFSFVEVLGNVGPKEGYLPELVIKNGATTPEYGGGLCQVSTTTFRAAVKAGLEITERKNHAYPVKYYSPQGTDATIYPPHPDLRFRNNTPAYILIQTRVEGNNLYFDFYGSDDGRKVELVGPVVYDKKSDGSMKAVWTQKVFDKDGNLQFEKKFYSDYKSPALYPHKNPLE